MAEGALLRVVEQGNLPARIFISRQGVYLGQVFRAGGFPEVGGHFLFRLADMQLLVVLKGQRPTFVKGQGLLGANGCHGKNREKKTINDSHTHVMLMGF